MGNAFFNIEVEISPHTSLINKVISIALTPDIFEPPKDTEIQKLKFEVTGIEEQIDGTYPDVILTSQKENYVLVFECKNKNIEEEQLKRYQSLTKEDLLGKIPFTEEEKWDFEIVYALAKQKEYPFPEVPKLVFLDNKIIKIHAFKNEIINNVFSPEIRLKKKYPMSFYPFSSDDEEHVIASFVLNRVVNLVIAQKDINEILFNEEEILRLEHPLWDRIGEREKKELKGKVRRILGRISRSSEFREYLMKVKDKKRREWKLLVKDLEMLKKKSFELISKLKEKEEKLRKMKEDQSELSRFMS